MFSKNQSVPAKNYGTAIHEKKAEVSSQTEEIKKLKEIIRLFLALPTSLIGGALYASSMAQQINPKSGNYLETFWKAMSVSSAAGGLNTVARGLDHYDVQGTTKNKIAALISLSISLAQIELTGWRISSKKLNQDCTA
jgi:hypothetical protein